MDGRGKFSFTNIFILVICILGKHGIKKARTSYRKIDGSWRNILLRIDQNIYLCVYSRYLLGNFANRYRKN